MIETIIQNSYGLHPTEIQRSRVGAGSDTYFVTCDEGRFVLKFPSAGDINHPEQEPQLCEFLLRKNLPVSRFLKNRSGSFFAEDKNGRLCTLQEFLEGTTCEWNTADDALLREQAELLGRIHTAMRGYPGLPEGIGEGFFRFMTPERAKGSYEASLLTARQQGDRSCEEDLMFRIALMEHYPKAAFDMTRLTCGATHGDYFISQLLCCGSRINAVIDWTCACVHPLVWELVRSYVYAAPECARGIFDDARFAEYTAHYERFAPLSAYDKTCTKALYFYQIAVCDYYGQYYGSHAANRSIYLEQARLATKLLRAESRRS